MQFHCGGEIGQQICKTLVSVCLLQLLFVVSREQATQETVQCMYESSFGLERPSFHPPPMLLVVLGLPGIIGPELFVFCSSCL